jgi:MFS family permease
LQHGNRWWLVIGTALGFFMVTLDSSIVTVGLPTIGSHFQAPAALTEWTIVGYLLPMIALVLPAGRWLDQNGRRPAFAVAILGFAAASAAAGLAPGIGWLIGARVVQGAFGALLTALVPTIVTESVGPDVRGRAMSIMATVGPAGAVAGPAAGGVLIATLGWPAIFFVNVPVSVAVLVVAFHTMAGGGGLRLPSGRWLTDSVLLAAGCGALLAALTLAPTRGLPWLLVALVAVPVVAAWSRLSTSRPVVVLLRAPGMASPVIALLCTVAGIAGVQFLAPYFLQESVHVGSAVTGLVVLAQPAAMAPISPIGGYLADRWGARRTAVVGALIMVAGLVLAAPLSSSWQPFDLAWRLALVGVGTGLFAGPNMAIAMRQAPAHLLATAGATTGLARSLAFALGPALATIPWALAAYSPAGMRTSEVLLVVAAALGAAAAIAGLVWRRGAAAEVESSARQAA